MKKSGINNQKIVFYNQTVQWHAILYAEPLQENGSTGDTLF